MSKPSKNDEEYYGAKPIKAATTAKPAAIRSSFPASYSPEDFPWDKLQVLPAKQSTVRKTAYFSSVKLRGAPPRYRLRMHLLGIKSNFGFCPPMGFEELSKEEQKNAKFSYSCELEEGTLSSFQTGDSILQPQIFTAGSGQKALKFSAESYQKMAKEGKSSSDGGADYPAALKVKVQMNDQGNPDKVTFLQDGKVVKDVKFWEQFQRIAHTADALIELSRVYFAAGKCGVIWNLIRLRPSVELGQDAVFPDEGIENDDDDEGSTSNTTNTTKEDKDNEKNGDEDDNDNDATKNRKRKRINNANENEDENNEQENEEGQKRPKKYSESE